MSWGLWGWSVGWQWWLLGNCLLAKDMVFVTMWSLWHPLVSSQKHCEWLLAQCHPTQMLDTSLGKEGIKPGILQMHSNNQCTFTSVKYPSNLLTALNNFHYFRIMFLLEPVWQPLYIRHQKHLTFRQWNISSTQTIKMSFEKAFLSVVISSILMALYGVLSSRTFPNAAEPFPPPLY